MKEIEAHGYGSESWRQLQDDMIDVHGVEAVPFDHRSAIFIERCNELAGELQSKQPDVAFGLFWLAPAIVNLHRNPSDDPYSSDRLSIRQGLYRIRRSNTARRLIAKIRVWENYYFGEKIPLASIWDFPVIIGL